MGRSLRQQQATTSLEAAAAKVGCMWSFVFSLHVRRHSPHLILSRKQGSKRHHSFTGGSSNSDGDGGEKATVSRLMEEEVHMNGAHDETEATAGSRHYVEQEQRDLRGELLAAAALQDHWPERGGERSRSSRFSLRGIGKKLRLRDRRRGRDDSDGEDEREEFGRPPVLSGSRVADDATRTTEPASGSSSREREIEVENAEEWPAVSVENFAAPVSDEGVVPIEEGSEPQESAGSETSSSSAMKQEDSSPVSVLEELFLEADDDDCSNAGQKPELDTKTTTSDGASIWFSDECEESGGLESENEKESRHCYIRSVVDASGLEGEESLQKWFLSEQLLDPKQSPPEEESRKLLFDFIGEALSEIQRTHFSFHSCWGSEFRKIQMQVIRRDVVREVNSAVDWHCRIPFTCSLEKIIGDELERASSAGIGTESGAAANRIADGILENLMQELISESVFF